jgi:hypothetical protein
MGALALPSLAAAERLMCDFFPGKTGPRLFLIAFSMLAARISIENTALPRAI